MAQSRILQTIQRSFVKLMPVTMIGGFAPLFKEIDFGGYQAWLRVASFPLAPGLCRVKDFEAMCSDQLNAWIVENNIEIISFNDIR